MMDKMILICLKNAKAKNNYNCILKLIHINEICIQIAIIWQKQVDIEMQNAQKIYKIIPET